MSFIWPVVILFITATTALAKPAKETASKAGDERMSVGAQIGAFGNAGAAGQYLLTPNSALNANVGLIFGTLTLGVDYIYMFGEQPLGYAAQAGTWIPYLGGGLQTGWFGGLRGVGGVQYKALTNPFAFFGSLVLVSTSLGGGLGGILGGRYVLD